MGSWTSILTSGPLLTALGSVIVTLITVGGTILLGRRKAKVDIDTSVSTSVKGFAELLIAERKDLLQIIKELRADVESISDSLERERAARGNFAGRAVELELFLRRHGIEPPPPSYDIHKI